MACSKRNCSPCGCRHNSWAQVNYPDVSACSSSSGSGCSACRGGCGKPCRPPWSPAENTANFGLLRTVPDYSDYRAAWPDYPFYSGPCGPCESDCGCCDHSCCHHGCRPPCPGPMPQPTPPWTACPANASFVAGGPLSLAAGDNVTLSSIAAETPGFIPTTSGIRIQNAGTYMVIYTVQIPAGDEVATRFQLNLDGVNIPSSIVDITAVAGSENTSSYTMHALVQAGENSLLNLNTLNAFAITTATSGGAAVVTLSIVQLC